jgi:hypothetical protein
VEPKTSEEPLSALAQCALGHEWQLDLDDLAAQVLAALQADGVAATEVTATGSQRLDWTLEGHVTLDVDYTLAATLPGPEEGQVLTVTETHDGVVSGRAYINGAVAIPRHWDMSELDSDTVATLDGVEQETVPFVYPVTVFDDELGLVTTCDGDAMSLQPRGRDLVQLWSRAS